MALRSLGDRIFVPARKGDHFDVGDPIGSSTSEQRQPNFARFGPCADFTQLQ